MTPGALVIEPAQAPWLRLNRVEGGVPGGSGFVALVEVTVMEYKSDGAVISILKESNFIATLG